MSNIFSQIKDLLSLLKVGKEVSNPATWKNRQNTINAISAIFIAVFSLVGINVPQETITAAAAGIFSIVSLLNIIITTISSKKVGLPSNDSTGNTTGTIS